MYIKNSMNGIKQCVIKFFNNPFAIRISPNKLWGFHFFLFRKNLETFVYFTLTNIKFTTIEKLIH